MKKILSLLFVIGASVYSNAQNLPKNSPQAGVEQTVGATQIKIDYSRPGVKERTIFGGLVPYDKLWRFGANSATTIQNEHSLFFEGNELKPGTYSMFAIPGKEYWEIIFNTDTKATENSFDKDKTVLNVKGKASDNSNTETLLIGFDHLKDESASIIVLWEKTKVEIPFTVNTNENSIVNIKAAIEKGEDLANVYNNAANYYYSSSKDFKKASDMVKKSIEIESTYRNLFMKARIDYELGDKKGAIKTGQEALKLAKDKEASIGYQNYIEGTVKKWMN